MFKKGILCLKHCLNRRNDNSIEKANLSPFGDRLAFVVCYSKRQKAFYKTTFCVVSPTFTIYKPFVLTGIVVALPL